MCVFGHSFVKNLPKNPFRKYNVKILGVGGGRARSIMDSQEYTNLLAFKPEFCFVQIGGNDIHNGYTSKEICMDIYNLYTALKAENINVVFGEVFIRPKPYVISPKAYQSKRTAINHCLRKMFSDRYDLLKYNNADSTFIKHDGVHLNGKGYRMFTNAILIQMEKFLRENYRGIK